MSATDGMTGLLTPQQLELAWRGALDVAAAGLLLFGLYWRRYRDKELVTTAALINVCVFAVLTVLSQVAFGLGAGFGLFAILALFTLRSEALGKVEISYFFASVVIAVLCAVQGTSPALVLAVVALVLAGAWLIDHPRVLRSVARVSVTLDRIDAGLLADPVALHAALSQRLGVEVMATQVNRIDYIQDLARIHVFYRPR